MGVRGYIAHPGCLGDGRQAWAHLGSNQEQPGYEPGALTD
jgi:hypothetical protein